MKVQKLKETQLLESGQAQEATKVRDQALAAADAWIRVYRGVVRVTLDDDPQQMEKLGITVMNAPRAKKTT